VELRRVGKLRAPVGVEEFRPVRQLYPTYTGRMTITARTPGPNTILSSFERSCSIYSIIETLGAATDLEEIRKYTTLPENIDATIESLTIVDALKSSNIQTELKRSRDRAALVKALTTAGAGTGILAFSMREGLGSPIPRRPRYTERGCGRA
jgi:hypothetical protein